MSIMGISSYESYNRLESTTGKIKAHQVARLADHFGDAKFFIKFMFGELDWTPKFGSKRVITSHFAVIRAQL